MVARVGVRFELLAALLLGAIIGIPGPAAGQTTDSLRVRRVALGIVRADNERALEEVLGYYAADAVLLPPGAPPVVGLPAIRPRYEALFRDFDPAIESRIAEIVVDGSLAYVRGRNRGSLRGRNGNPDRTLNDAYLMILRRGDGTTWRITRLMWHPADSARRP